MTNFGHHFDFSHQIHGYYAENQEYESTTFRKSCQKDHHTEIEKPISIREWTMICSWN